MLLRHPRLADGARLWRGVKECGGLDLNSSYLYLLLSDQFAQTCLLAEQGDELLGFVTAYLRPDHPDVLFVWQVGVLPQARGQGLARRLLLELLQRPACAELGWIEATVSADNQASRRLFSGLAQELDAKLMEQDYMTQNHFPAEGGHAAEPLLRIGPLLPQINQQR
ncbi:MAG: diaminobutyrate acetyltransferase [Gammaproteobacteria bacterium]|nr:diaminobutyrate acetyltransferase [Gammaproteobacteria bacterium]